MSGNKLCWIVGDTLGSPETVHGQFSTWVDAVKNVKEYMKDHNLVELTVTIGFVEYIKPSTYASAILNSDVYGFLSEMSKAAKEDLNLETDIIFEFKNSKLAKRTLCAILEEWADEYIQSNVWTIQTHNSHTLTIDEDFGILHTDLVLSDE
jgi:hypothetical protein